MTPPIKKSATAVRFSADEDDILIEFVRSHPFLYDLSDADYKNLTKKDLLWIEAGKMINKDGSECKKRWKSMRDHYKRGKKEEKGTTGSAAKKKRALYWNRLRFLDVADGERDSFCYVPDAVIEEASTSSVTDLADLVKHGLYAQSEKVSSKNSSNHGPKDRGSQDTTFRHTASKTGKENLTLQNYPRRHDDIANSTTFQESDTEIDLFFKTMAATVKKFRPDLATHTKMSVFKVVTKMELLNQRPPAGFVDISHDDFPQYSGSPSSSESS